MLIYLPLTIILMITLCFKLREHTALYLGLCYTGTLLLAEYPAVVSLLLTASVHVLYVSSGLDKKRGVHRILDSNVFLFSVLIIHLFTEILPDVVIKFFWTAPFLFSFILAYKTFKKSESLQGILSTLSALLCLSFLFPGLPEYLLHLNLAGVTMTLLFQIKIREKELIQDKELLQKEKVMTFDCFKGIEEVIHSEKDISFIFSGILNSAADILPCDAGGIYLLQEEEYKLISSGGPFIPLNLLDLSLEDTWIPNTETHPSPVIKALTRDSENYISSLIIRPLVTHDHILGYMVLEQCRFGRKFNEQAWQQSRLFADFSSLALENLEKNRELIHKKHMEKEIEIAASIQKGLLPEKLPPGEKEKISIISQPARNMSGDYYDIITLPKNKIMIIICDVAGKGVPAAIVTVIIRTIVNMVAPQVKNASTVLNWVNRGLTGQVDIERYATMSCIIIDQEEKKLIYSNAGHHPSLLKRDDSVIEITKEGLPVGITSQADYSDGIVSYKEGDSLLIYTDGICESMNSSGEQFSRGRIKEHFQHAPWSCASSLVSSLFSRSEKFSSPSFSFDDRTIIGVTL